MIDIEHLKKSFGDTKAVNDVSLNIKEGEVFGLVGTNGAGKSTLLRMLAGILRPDEGQIRVDDRPVYDNPVIKQDVFFISDDAYFFPNATPRIMRDYYASLYPRFDTERFDKLAGGFHLGRRLFQGHEEAAHGDPCGLERREVPALR